jgi:hypothetical protein
LTVIPGQQTVAQPGDNTRLNALLIRSVAVGALGGLLFGFDTAVIAGTTQQLQLPQAGVAAWETNLMEVVQTQLGMDRGGGVLRL